MVLHSFANLATKKKLMPPTRKNAKYFKKKVPARFHYWPFGVRSHGRHCGPYWSDGRWQKSVCGRRGIDGRDETCRDHDCRIHHGLSRKWADRKFVKANWGKSVARSFDAAAVYMNGYFESDSSPKKNEIMSHMFTPGKSPRRNSVGMSAEMGTQVSLIVPGESKLGGSGKVVFKGGHMPSLQKVKHMRHGAVNVVETNQSGVFVRTGYMGHITFPTQKMGLMMCRAMIRGIYQAIDVDFTDWDDSIPTRTSSATETIIIRYSTTYVSTVVSTISVLGVTTYKAYADALWTSLRGIYTTNRNPRFFDLEYQYQQVIDVDEGAAVSNVTLPSPGLRVNLQGTKFEFDVQSIMKLQNVTSPTTGASDPDETTAIDAVPLYYRVYTGKGTGTTLKTTTQNAIPFVGDSITGVFNIDGTSGAPNDELYEMPEKQNFTSVKSVHNGIFQPGEILQFVLGYNKKYTFQSLAPLFNNDLSAQYQYMHAGSFQFVGFDKVLQQVGDASNIAVQNETEQTFCCTMQMAKKQAIISINDTL